MRLQGHPCVGIAGKVSYFASIGPAMTKGGKVGQTVRVLVKDKDGKKESQTDVRGARSNRYVWKFGKMLQVSWSEFGHDFTHIHCKLGGCDNNWNARSTTELSDLFDVERLEGSLWRITCKRCGRMYESG